MTAQEPTILATCGGMVDGGWQDTAYGPLLHFAIELADVDGRAPRVAHVNTAGGDPRFVEGAELEAARAAGVEGSHIRLFPHPNHERLAEHVLSRDVIWVSGGSVVNLLALWRAHGLDDLLRQAWEAGVVLAGGSAGGLCWHSGGTTTSFGPDAQVVADGLGLLPGSFSPHHDSQPTRRPAFRDAIAAGRIPPGYGVEEGVGLLYRGSELVEVVAERPGAVAWSVSADGIEERLPARVLPSRALPSLSLS
ncbi:peptidase E [Microbacterium sp. MYb64]|uniref:Type 1 glutamine amidotransferase-like domain-containing protein n=1 Tax=Microbacterium sp. MYb64 TaxID=1848691 RepID=UPI000CFCAF79|nr:peptidase E [Microbacterium sp. MYb64]PRB09135.1 peptidase E [Microbacterium sp. MYb64]